MPSSISPSMLSIVNDVYEKELASAIKKMQNAISSNQKYLYDKHKKEIEDYHNKLAGKGVKLKPMGLPEWGGPSLKDLTAKPTKTAKPLKKSVGKATEMVAGRTGKQIEAAKRAQTKRLGKSGASGMSKRCKKGKSCGATCINSYKVCLVDIPWASAVGIPKVVKDIQGREVKPKKPAKVKDKPVLGKFETSLDFERKLKDSFRGYSESIKQMHSFMNKLLGFSITSRNPNYENDKEKGKFDTLRSKFFKALGNGDEAKGMSLASFAFKSIITFTGSEYGEIRDAQMGIKPDAKYLKMAKAIERIVNSPNVERPAVEKFRGIRVDDGTLKGMIESAKLRGTYGGQALASWSTDLNTSRRFADDESYNGKDRRVILRAINSRGVPVRSISSLPDEYEILTSGSANYKYLGYKKILQNGIEYHVFDVEES